MLKYLNFLSFVLLYVLFYFLKGYHLIFFIKIIIPRFCAKKYDNFMLIKG